MPISISMIAVSSQLAVAVADRVPAFDINRSCRLDLAATAGLSVDQTTKSCVNDEKRARQQLASQWSKFSASRQGGMRPAGEHRRHTKLRQSFDLPAIGSMGPLIGPSWCILCQDRLATLSFIGEPGKSQPTNEAQENILSFT